MPHRVFRFARSDRDGFVLVQVRPDGARSLDVKLVGTEGEFPYMVSLRQAQVCSPRIKSGPCTDAEWQSILESVIRQDPLHDVEVTATVESEACLSITIRKRVGEVTQRLGSVTLKYRPEEAIELFEWCGDSVAAAVKLGEDLAAAERSQSELEQAVRVLKSQLDEFVAAKERDETLWLEKFRDLVNEKKAKIREQQSRLTTLDSGSRVPGGSAAAVPGAQQAQAPSPSPEPSAAPTQTAKKTGRKPGPSRPGKRKTRAALLKEEEAAEAEAAAAAAANRRGAASAAAVPDPAADRMDVDHDTDGEPMSSHQVTTDDDDVTASETDGADGDGDDDDGIEAAVPARPAPAPAPASTSPEPSSRRQPVRRAPARRAPAQKASQKHGSQQEAAETANAQVEALDAPPPRRELPFGASKTRPGPGLTEAEPRKAQPKEAEPRGADSESETGFDEEL